jgi:hypothetical protein
MNMTKLTVLCVAAFATAAAALAQNEAPKSRSETFYRLDFALKEMEGAKLVKTRNYQMMMTANYGMSSIRSGAKIPVVDGKATQYIDVGVNVDVHNLWTTKDGLELEIVAEASGVLDAPTGAQLTKQPMIYQTKWDSRVEIPIGKPTTVFSSDDPSSKHQLQLEVTATPIH